MDLLLKDISIWVRKAGSKPIIVRWNHDLMRFCPDMTTQNWPVKSSKTTNPKSSSTTPIRTITATDFILPEKDNRVTTISTERNINHICGSLTGKASYTQVPHRKMLSIVERIVTISR